MLIKPVSLPLWPRHIDHTLGLTSSGTAAFLTLRGRVSRFSLRDGNEGTVEVQLRTGLLISYLLATPPTTLPTDMDADTASIDADATSTISSTGSAGGVRFRTRKNESDVYNYIKELNTGHFQCMVCARASVNQIWRTRSTTNWRGHLLSHHSDVYNPQAESSLGVFGRRTRSCTEAERMSPEDAKVCDDKLVVWIVANAYPFAVVDQEEFVAFCKALHPGYNVPCQRTIRKKVLRQWKMEKEAARVEIRREIAGRRCSFTTDMWTSPSKRGYMVITMNFIDSNWEMRSVIIAFKRVQYPHTGNRLAEHFIKAVKDMDGGILSSIWTVTVDNATNNTAMVRMMNRKLPSEIVRLARSAFEENVPESVPSPSDTSAQQVVQLSCTAHVLQLAVKEGLAKCPLVDSAIGYFRDLAKKISESTKLTEALQQVCADMLHDFITPKLDVVTRWNSTWIMLDSLLRMKLPLNELLRRIELKEPPYAGLTIGPGDSLIKEITEESWTAVKTLFTFLEPINEATDMLSASTYPTFGILLLTNHVIKFHAAETIEKTQDEHTKKFADAVKRKLDDYAPKLDKREARIATVLDPRAKQHLDVLVENVASVKQEVMDEFNQHYRAAFQAQQQSNRGPPSAQKKKGKSLRLLLARSTHQVASAGSVGAAEQTLDAGSNNAFVGEASRNLDVASDDDDSFAKELDRWLAADGMSEMTESRDVCTWFRVTGDVYPRIKLMAQDFLAITATSVPSEIAFSAAGIALSNRRARLGDDAVEAICELKSFFKFNQRKELHPSGTHE